MLGTKKRLDLTHISYNLSADGAPLGGTGEKHISIAEYTGVGYDRHAADNGQNGGTPGYDNRSVVNEELVRDKNGKIITPHQSVHEGIVTISEIMLATHTAADDADRTPRATRLPQWIEIYNAHMTKTVNLKQWYLEIRLGFRRSDYAGPPRHLETPGYEHSAKSDGAYCFKYRSVFAELPRTACDQPVYQQ